MGPSPLTDAAPTLLELVARDELDPTARLDELEPKVGALEERIDRAELDEETQEAIAALPKVVIRLEGNVTRALERTEGLGQAHGQVRRELENVRGTVADGFRDVRSEFATDVARIETAIAGLNTLVVARFDVVDQAHTTAAAVRWDNKPYVERFKDVMVIATPILLGLLTLAGVIYAAKIGAGAK